MVWHQRIEVCERIDGGARNGWRIWHQRVEVGCSGNVLGRGEVGKLAKVVFGGVEVSAVGGTGLALLWGPSFSGHVHLIWRL